MKNFLKVTLIAAACGFIYSTGALADDPVPAGGTVNVTGTIIASACKITPSDASMTVPFGTISGDTISGPAGTTGPAKQFVIHITGCPKDEITGMSVNFSGISSTENPSLVALTDANADGTAKNIAVGIYEHDNTTLIPINNNSKPVPINEDGSATPAYIIKYVKTNASDVTAGTANAVINYSVTYN